ncbi:hypothetical protein J2125_000551 [Erwinia toletana]|uniref:DUF943 family protein n=1 Tax=Winslowiella toletana TaxID=92490 RepID=A0ABS4P3X6_9GAMM|nr:DUF943 family protein [Winslowiella toletana]MBP2167359.1 hypothetical protein [Winslowiella toletana]
MLKIKYIIAPLIAIVVIAGYLNFVRKPEIVLTDQELNFSNLAVKELPLTEKGKIAWWKNNKGKIKSEFDIPVPAKNGDWYINVWNYGNGFKEKPKGDIRIFNAETQDMMCFNNDNGKCIEKDLLMRIENNKDGTVSIEIGNNKVVVK